MLAAALTLVRSWDAASDGMAQKSRELILHLLKHSAKPFSRNQFTPGHVTATAVVLHPKTSKVLLVHHARLDRWLLPGGHVEAEDKSLEAAAAREALEETGARITQPQGLVGLDVHGIPRKMKRGVVVEPYHLHHDLIFGFRAASIDLMVSAESRDVKWVPFAHLARFDVPEPIVHAVNRAAAGGRS